MQACWNKPTNTTTTEGADHDHVQHQMLKLLTRRTLVPAQAEDAGEIPSPRPAADPEDALRGLVRSSIEGSQAAQRTLLTNLGPSMLQMIRRVLGSRDPEVEDTFQDAAWGFVSALPAFRETCSTRHFACRIALLSALKTRRRRRAASVGAEIHAGTNADGEPLLESLAAETPSPSEEALASSRRALLHRMLDDLPQTQASVLLLHCVGGFTVEEVASSMETPLETTRSRLRLGKAALRAMIAADPAASELLEVSP